MFPSENNSLKSAYVKKLKMKILLQAMMASLKMKFILNDSKIFPFITHCKLKFIKIIWALNKRIKFYLTSGQFLLPIYASIYIVSR